MARKIIYAAIILLAIIVVPWTLYIQYLFKKGDSLRVKGKYVEAAKILKKSQDISLGFQINRKELSNAYLDIVEGLTSQPRPDYALCEDLCKRAISLSNDPAEAHRELSDVYYGQAKYDEALAHIDAYLALRKNDAKARKIRDSRRYFAIHAKASRMTDRGAELQRQGKIDDAITVYEQAIKEYPQFPFIRNYAANAYFEKYAYLPNDQKLEDEKLNHSAVAVLEDDNVSDELKSLLGNAEAIKKRGVHYKLAAVYVRLNDFDRAIREYEKYVAENPDDKSDVLVEALRKAKKKADEDARRGMVGGPAGAQTSTAGRMMGGFRERFKYSIELIQLIRKLPKLDDKVAISPEQAEKILPLLREIESAEKMPQNDAKAKIAFIKDVLSESQLTAIENIVTPRRRSRGNGMMPGMSNGQGTYSRGRGPRDPEANPFKRERLKKSLTTLIGLLEEKTAKKKN